MRRASGSVRSRAGHTTAARSAGPDSGRVRNAWSVAGEIASPAGSAASGSDLAAFGAYSFAHSSASHDSSTAAGSAPAGRWSRCEKYERSRFMVSFSRYTE